MIKEQTLFILGAGASVPYGYPTGKALRLKIIQDTEMLIRKYFSHIYEDQKQSILTFIKAFKYSSDFMIDYFLATREEFKDLGKLAIFLNILNAEENHRDKFRENSNDKDDDWLSYIFNRVYQNALKKEDYKLLGQNKINFVTFNYDRTLEHFFLESMVNKFGISNEEALKEFNQIEVHHVFGRLPELQSENGFFYYGSPQLTTVRNLYKAGNIKTLHERDNIEKEIIFDLIREAKRIFFLGFGYANENLQLLKLHNNIFEKKEIYGTAYMMNENEIEKAIQNMRLKEIKIPGIADFQLEKPKLINKKSLELLRSFL